jgi:hypothetical protein
MNTLVMKKLCGTILLTGCACGAAFAQQTYGTDSATGASPGGAGSSMSPPGSSGGAGMSPGGDTSSYGTSGAPATGESAGSGGVSSASSGMPGTISPSLTPDIPGASNPSDADPYKQVPKRQPWHRPWGGSSGG